MSEYNCLEKFGLVFITILVLYVLKIIWNALYDYVLGPEWNKVDFKAKGKWALVTGSTDGIGKEYARQLAERGCDIILVSRSLDKLKAVASEIEKDFKVKTKIVQADFSKGDSIYENIAKEIKDLEIGTLVNNVGIYYQYPEYFLDIPEFEQLNRQMIEVNITSMTRMTALVMPGMVKRKSGVIINISSVAAWIPGPLHSLYAASKAFAVKFTESLRIEYSSSGIIIQSVHPGYVNTNMTVATMNKTTLLSPLADKFVRSALSLVGTAAVTTGYLPHSIMINTLTFINKTTNLGGWLVKRQNKVYRLRALKKIKDKES